MTSHPAPPRGGLLPESMMNDYLAEAEFVERALFRQQTGQY
ncbi:MAG: hypothetical protein OXC07_04000 [Kistimonas sp.]|nr:hypothetical protein [Kistimonas sp.]